MATPPTPVEVFSSSEQLFDRLFVLTNDALFTANPDKPLVAGLAAKVLATGPMVKSVVPDAEEIFTEHLFREDQPAPHRSQRLPSRWHPGPDEEHRLRQRGRPRSRIRVHETAVGSGLRERRKAIRIAGAAFAPLVTTLVLAGLTWFLMGAARELDEGVEVQIRGSQRAAKGIAVLVLDVLGPTGTMVLGGLLVAASVAWLVGRRPGYGLVLAHHRLIRQ